MISCTSGHRIRRRRQRREKKDMRDNDKGSFQLGGAAVPLPAAPAKPDFYQPGADSRSQNVWHRGIIAPRGLRACSDCHSGQSWSTARVCGYSETCWQAACAASIKELPCGGLSESEPFGQRGRAALAAFVTLSTSSSAATIAFPCTQAFLGLSGVWRPEICV